MRTSWIVLVAAIVFGAFCIGLAIVINGDAERIERKTQLQKSQKCPANDIIIYTDDKGKTYSCPVEGQQLTIVREPNYTTYMKCTCQK